MHSIRSLDTLNRAEVRELAPTLRLNVTTSTRIPLSPVRQTTGIGNTTTRNTPCNSAKPEPPASAKPKPDETP